jgi:hypothetical protein
LKLLPAPQTKAAEPQPPMSLLGRGVEHAGVLLFFFGAGWLLDRWLGTRPWLTLTMTAVGIVGQFARDWYAYDAEMRQHDIKRQANSTPPEGTTP